MSVSQKLVENGRFTEEELKYLNNHPDTPMKKVLDNSFRKDMSGTNLIDGEHVSINVGHLVEVLNQDHIGFKPTSYGFVIETPPKRTMIQFVNDRRVDFMKLPNLHTFQAILELYGFQIVSNDGTVIESIAPKDARIFMWADGQIHVETPRVKSLVYSNFK